MWWLQRVRPVVKSEGQLIVAIYVWRPHAITNREPFDVPNVELKEFGIDRHVKYRTLIHLANAKLITLWRSGCESLTVTIQEGHPR
jgi:hypothetical protein